ncbi:hypothetical protein CDAR_496071 [Caerostris darwini]|uniref:Uncharacterized protein n=1 Tax=Caerostris darwini TaxID=1538125 RepID=A0AAV4U1W8_9ARAC|nr:hypothetical protein CDAR_496071 [Caerostris darwini]
MISICKFVISSFRNCPVRNMSKKKKKKKKYPNATLRPYVIGGGFVAMAVCRCRGPSVTPGNRLRIIFTITSLSAGFPATLHPVMSLFQQGLSSTLIYTTGKRCKNQWVLERVRVLYKWTTLCTSEVQVP